MFVQGHRDRGNECRFVTFFKSAWDYEEDICLNLRLMPNLSLVQRLRKTFRKAQHIPDVIDLGGSPPFWQPKSPLEKQLFQLRDMVNRKKIQKTIDTHDLNSFDIFHFEQGIDPFRDGRWVKELAGKGKGIVCFYHGSDLRNRGVIREVHHHAQLNLTSEIDLLSRIEGMKYLYLPIDTRLIEPVKHIERDKLRVGHAARNRYFKGSDKIERIVRDLEKEYSIEWVMIENMTHTEAMKVKISLDIFIDQITDAGGWGYGASSVESLAMGIPTMTRINPEVDKFLGNHPFISVDEHNLKRELIDLIESKEKRQNLSQISRKWVIERHDIESVMDVLYGYYDEAGLI